MTLASTISNELKLVRYQSGIMLARNDDNESCSVGHWMEKSFNVFFIDRTDNVVELNDPCWSSHGFHSRKDAIGAGVSKICNDKSIVHRYSQTNANIIRLKQNSFVNESIIFRNNEELKTLSFKMPWFNIHGEVIGIFGCALNVTNAKLEDVAEDLNYLKNALHPNSVDRLNSIREQLKRKYQFTSREIDVLSAIIRGKTIREAAIHLELSPRTVEYYLANLKNKTGIDSKSQLIEKMYDYFR